MEYGELNPDDYTVAWIAPLQIEFEAALHMLDDEHHGRFAIGPGDDYVFRAGTVLGHNVVIATLPPGTEYGTGSAAALAAQVKKFFPRLWFGLLVGVALGLPNLSRSPPRDIRLGDVLVALPEGESAGLIAYELGKETDEGFELLRKGHVLARTEPVIRSAIGNIKSYGSTVTNHVLPFYNEMKDEEHENGTFARPGDEEDILYIMNDAGVEQPIQRDQRPLNRQTRVWYGPIGSGDKLLKNRQARDRLREQYDVIGLEMEAAGTMNQIPVGVIRGVCDYGDRHKNKKWQPYAAAMAAAYAKAVLREIRAKKTVKKAKLDDDKYQENVQRCFQSLCSTTSHIREIEEPTDNTTLWLRNDPMYKKWLNRESYSEHQGLLWIKGKPGAGKSTIMHSMANECKTKERPKFDNVLSFSFFAKQETSLDLYGSLILQLAKRDLQIREKLMAIWKEKKSELFGLSKSRSWQKAELLSLLKQALSSASTRSTIILIDGLDECKPSEDGSNDGLQDARKIVRFLQNCLGFAIQAGMILNICISSRDSLTVKHSGYEIKVDDHNQEDIRTYVRDCFESYNNCDDPTFQGLADEIVKKSAGIFLWARLTVDTLLQDLDHGKTLKYVRHHLNTLPQTLKDTYERMIIDQELSDYERKLACQLFQWVLFGSRPFRIREWYTILGLMQKGGIKSWKAWMESENYPKDDVGTSPGDTLEKLIRRLSSGLLEFSRSPERHDSDEDSMRAGPGSLDSNYGETRTVQLIHTSVRDFLLEQGFYLLTGGNWSASKLVSEANWTILRSCFDYLDLEELQAFVMHSNQKGAFTESTWSTSSNGMYRRNQVASFHSAASSAGSAVSSAGGGTSKEKLLPIHRLQGDKGTIMGIDDLLREESDTGDHVRQWIESLELPTSELSNDDSTVTDSSDFGGPAQLRVHIESVSGSVCKPLGRGDLIAFLDYATAEVFNHVDPATLDNDQITALAKLFCNHWDQMKIFRNDLRPTLSFVNFCLRVGMGFLVIPSLESQKSRSAVVDTFLKAASGGDSALVKAMIWRQIEVLSLPKLYESAIPAWRGFLTRLLESQIDGAPSNVDIWVANCKELFHKGSLAIDKARRCVQASDPDLLFIACERSQYDFMKTLLALGADPTRRYKNAGIIHCLIDSGGSWPPEKLEILCELVQGGADVNDKTGIMWTPLYRLCVERHPDIVPIRQLLVFQASVTTRDTIQRTPLHYVAENGHVDVLRMLLFKREVNVNAADHRGQTALHLAATNLKRTGNPGEECVIALINAGSDVFAQNSYGQTPRQMIQEPKSAQNSRIIQLLRKAEREQGTLLQRGKLALREITTTFLASNFFAKVIELIIGTKRVRG